MSDHITNNEESIVICIINSKTNFPKIIHLKANETEFLDHIHKSNYPYSILENTEALLVLNILIIRYLFVGVPAGFRRIAIYSIITNPAQFLGSSGCFVRSLCRVTEKACFISISFDQFL